ncbi:hypothetical protein PV328_005784 [Microctonus aethiopoides]|uniref:Uncharacterized protein n=1 Tax=Microctonus aethiopoides TaxID=144406 RepID=A0AA39FMP7_9HYME|nr:hypothetical protein PV328_005784 [Microctonus aethiopoides]
MKLQSKCKPITELVYVILFHIGASGNTLGRYFGNRGSNSLPYRIYLPYDYSTLFLYRFTVLLEFIIVFIDTHITAGFDSLFFGVMLQIISKINILKHRIQVSVATLAEMHDKESFHMVDYKKFENKFFMNWIKSHNAVIRVYNDSEFIFSKVMFVQYSTSALLICTIVYLISQMGIFTTKFMGNAGSLIALTGQIFIFCLSANQVTYEFADLRLGINNTDWFALSVSAKRNIVFMMVRTLKPVVFTSGYMVTLSLESFKSLMKVAYSMYSVLNN